jgi:L-iditol 2-dehydrogenase
MRKLAIEYPSQGRVELVDIGDPPKPEGTSVLIETEYSGMTNGTERHALRGEHVWKGFFPSRHGYQHVGRVVATGEEVTYLKEGDPTFFGQYVGHRGWNVVDASEKGPESYDSQLLMRLPDGFGMERAGLLGVAGVAMRGVRRFGIGQGNRVWVAGAGLIGQFAWQASVAMGAEVTVSEPIPMRLDLARKLGASRAISPTDPDYEGALRRGGPYDVIIDACGAPSLLEDVRRLGLLSHGAVVGLLAVRSETTFMWSMLHGTEASIEVSCHFSIDELNLLIKLVSEGRIRIDPLITHREPIENAEKIYGILRDRPSDLLGVIFDWA